MTGIIELQKHLGYFITIFYLYQCDQGMLSNRFSWKCIEDLFLLVTVASIFLQKTYLATILAFLSQACNQGTLQG